MYYRISISNLGNIFNPSNNEVNENDTAVITSALDITKKLNFTLLAKTSYGITESLSIYSEACFRFLDTKINIIERDNPLWVVLILFFGIFVGVSIVVICYILHILKKKRRKKTIAPALIAAIMGTVSSYIEVYIISPTLICILQGENEDKGIFGSVKTQRFATTL